jgi:hypothetical protein
MTFEELFRDFWWLMFPIFGMFMAVWGMAQSDRRTRNMLDLIKSYTDQGKEPPPELLRLASQSLQDGAAQSNPTTRQNSSAWTLIVFLAMSAGFGMGWYMVRDQDFAFAFALVGIVMGVMAVGALFLLIFGRK